MPLPDAGMSREARLRLVKIERIILPQVARVGLCSEQVVAVRRTGTAESTSSAVGGVIGAPAAICSPTSYNVAYRSSAVARSSRKVMSSVTRRSYSHAAVRAFSTRCHLANRAK